MCPPEFAMPEFPQDVCFAFDYFPGRGFQPQPAFSQADAFNQIVGKEQLRNEILFREVSPLSSLLTLILPHGLDECIFHAARSGARQALLARNRDIAVSHRPRACALRRFISGEQGPSSSLTSGAYLVVCMQTSHLCLSFPLCKMGMIKTLNFKGYCNFVILFFVFLGPHPQHMDVPRLASRLELELPAYTTATAMWDPSHVCDLHHSSWHLNPLSEARDQCGLGLDPSDFHPFHFSPAGNLNILCLVEWQVLI